MAAELPPQIRQRTVAKARTLLEALPFMREHHGKVIVVKVRRRRDGPRAAREAVRRGRRAAACTPASRPVIVHGGGPQVTKVAQRLGIETTFVDGLRVTDAETLDVATMVLAGKLNTERRVVARHAAACRRSGSRGVDGGLLLARRRSAPDLGFVGEVVHVNAEVLRTLAAKGFVPVVASIAMDETTGRPTT